MHRSTSDRHTPSTPSFGAGHWSIANCSGGIFLELICWVAGLGLILTYMSASARLEDLRRQGVSLFSAARASAIETQHLGELRLSAQTLPASGGQDSNSLPGRSESDDSAVLPIAVLHIASIDMEVPVYRDPSALNLSRGAGWIGGTAAPNTVGNMAIAAHRDRYFRPLKDIRIGDRLVLDSLSGQRDYRVSRIDIVDPDDVSVLDDSMVPTVTLVTCYPFYFIGNAPQRFIVQATAIDHPESASIAEAPLTATSSGETP